MKNFSSVLRILPYFCIFMNLAADPVITLFIEPFAYMERDQDGDVIFNRLKKPGKIAKDGLKALSAHPINKGIFATYGGYLAMSNHNGQIRFARKHVVPVVYLLIADKITPVMMAGNTIHHWEIEKNTPAAMYKMERLHDESEETYYWLVQEVALPPDNKIPLESITIIAKPKHFYVPEGITLTNDEPNLVLPRIFVKKGIKINANALYVLNLRQFFGHIQPSVKKEVARYLSVINP